MTTGDFLIASLREFEWIALYVVSICLRTHYDDGFANAQTRLWWWSHTAPLTGISSYLSRVRYSIHGKLTPLTDSCLVCIRAQNALHDAARVCLCVCWWSGDHHRQRNTSTTIYAERLGCNSIGMLIGFDCHWNVWVCSYAHFDILISINATSKKDDAEF